MLIAIGNSGSRALADEALARIDDSAPDVRGTAIWALAKLAPERIGNLAATRLAREPDADIRSEWTQAMEKSAS